MSKLEAPDWDPVRELINRIKRGEPLTLTDDVIATLQRAAREVAIGAEEVEVALGSVRRATALLRKIYKRINDGSDRIMPALHQMYGREDAGDLEGARQLMQDILDVEVVPLYRSIAEGQLRRLDRMKALHARYAKRKQTTQAVKTKQASKSTRRRRALKGRS